MIRTVEEVIRELSDETLDKYLSDFQRLSNDAGPSAIILTSLTDTIEKLKKEKFNRRVKGIVND